jgi:NAD(P)-dependent dehydrogenase (short-subunit alcohol dehydrogenase family)
MAERDWWRGRVVVVTGASSGLGRAVIRLLAARRARIALIARGEQGLRAAQGEVTTAGAEALMIPADVADAAAVDAAARAVVARWGGIDVWVNNAMISVFSPIAELRPEELRRVTEVNYLGTVHGTRAALAVMRARNRGSIVQVGSALAYRSIPLQSAYCASKAAVRSFTDSLRSELAHEGSRVQLSMVQLPAMNTPHFGMARSRLGKHPRPVGPIFQPETIAPAVLHAAQHGPRELWVGGRTIEAIIGQQLIPGVLDRKLGREAWEAQTTEALAPSGGDNVDAPLPGDRGARGPFSGEALRFSLPLWGRLHPGRAALVAGAALMLAGAGVAGLQRLRR